MNIVLFDGVCNLCQKSIQFIIKHDKKNIFYFLSIQSDIGKEVLANYHINPEKLDTVILLNDKGVFYKSDAVLRILRQFNSHWRFFYCLIIIPKPIRDFFYSVIAKSRYSVFGKSSQCMMPSKSISNKFIQSVNDLKSIIKN